MKEFNLGPPTVPSLVFLLQKPKAEKNSFFFFLTLQHDLSTDFRLRPLSRYCYSVSLVVGRTLCRPEPEDEEDEEEAAGGRSAAGRGCAAA